MTERQNGLEAPTGEGGAEPLKLFFDGGCRPNPGEIEVAVVARGQLFHRSKLGYGTNDDAEWLALLHALDIAASMGAMDIILIGDSALVINQASGTTKCRSPRLREHLAAFGERRGAFKRIRLRHVGRHRNLAGGALDGLRWR